MSFLTAFLTQTATYWAKTGQNGFGEPTFAAPATINCRWEQKNTRIINAEGEEILCRATVFLEDDVDVGDYLFLGTSSTADPRTVLGAQSIKDARKIPSLDATMFERRVYL